ncbi:MAG: 6-oxocyclohex-1-ene-1-carbonyl-CoA hydratase, partial [Rhodospirillales bacterium]|nr:6-oxocyclohex-1-ene-1-carbonyl-CoA hydratase [Rhodospirillales bacterium]
MSKQTKSITDSTSPETLVDHNLAPAGKDAGILYDLRPALGADGAPVDGLFNAWITLDNPTQLNALTTDMMRGAILALKQASNARDVVC